VARHAQRQRAQQQRQQHRQRHADEERQPGRHAEARGEVGRRVGADADEGRLAEGGQPATPVSSTRPSATSGVQADVVELRDPEVRHRQQRQQQHHRGEGGEEFAHDAFMSVLLAMRVAQERHSSTGRIEENTITSLKALAQNEPKPRAGPRPGAHQRQRIARQPGEHRGDEALQADQEAAVVEDVVVGPISRPDSAPMKAAIVNDSRPALLAGDAHQPRAQPVDGGGAQRLAGRLRSKNSHSITIRASEARKMISVCPDSVSAPS
jgi:hypothetical protein